MYINNVVHSLDDELIFVRNLREEKDLSKIRTTYNAIVFCQAGRILVEMGGQQQVKVTPRQILLIPAGKLAQPMLISTDIEASAVLISDRLLKSLLGNQISIWNQAMYMKETYVIEETGWLNGFKDYAQLVFNENKQPVLHREIARSFLRTLLLLVCEDLVRHESMHNSMDSSTTHDKELFNRFLQLLGSEEQKRKGVAYYADQMHITPKYLSAICRKVSDKSPIRWITESVMQDSFMLLSETDMTVKEISRQLGFPNSSFFGQYFREQAGVTPIKYRSQHKRIL